MTLTDLQIIAAIKKLRQERRINLLSSLFPRQLECIGHASKKKAALCTRRAGKSYGAGSLMFQVASEHPGAVIPYIALTRGSAKNIMWPVLTKIIARQKIDCRLKESDLEIVMANGATIRLLGADQENFIDRLRGGAYPLAVIDEAQAFREHLKTLIDDVLEPAMLDYDGVILMLGTPGPVGVGYFWEATHLGKHGFTVFKWSVLDNPYLPNAREFIERRKRDNGWTDDNPTYRREWLGEWVEDPDALVYKYTEKNDYDDLPEGYDWTRILAVDYGFNDQTTFGICQYNRHMPDVWVPHAEGHSGWTPTIIAGRLKQIIETYRPAKIIADTGALGKMITEEMIRHYGIPMHAAEKKEKKTWISFMNGAFQDNTLHIHRSLTDLKSQLRGLAKDDKGNEDPRLPNDLTDCVIYGFRECRAYLHQPKAPDSGLNPEEEKIWKKIKHDLTSKDDGLDWFG